MAAAVLQQPLSNLALDGGIMPPSPVSQSFSRHGRKGSVSKASKTRGRGYSIIDERETAITKALSWVLKRTVQADEEQGEGESKVIADKEGWASAEEVLKQPNLADLEVTFEEIQALAAARSRIAIKTKPSSPADDSASSYLIRASTTPPTSQAPTSPTTQKMTPLTISTPDLPSLIVYETSYANYPLILASGGIKRAGGQAYLAFSPIHTTDIPTPSVDADVSIYISISAAMAGNEKLIWLQGENGTIYTEGDAKGVVGKEYWLKAVGRRSDIGVLFEDGEVRKEVPIGLRGKGVKGKGKKGGMKSNMGRGNLKEMKARSEDENSSSE